MSYDPVNDQNGAIDPKVYFERSGKNLKATLQLQLSSSPTEINEPVCSVWSRCPSRSGVGNRDEKQGLVRNHNKESFL
jgi:hypothetical protein